jgi:hypothetical protein
MTEHKKVPDHSKEWMGSARAAAQASRYEARIINQRDSISRLIDNPSAQAEIEGLHAELAIWRARAEAMAEQLEPADLLKINQLHPIP